MNITDVLSNRYAAKEFDTSKKLSPQQKQEIKDLLRMSPSSTNIQPWQFIVATTAAGKARIAKSCNGMFEFNKSKILNASAVIVFASLKSLSEDYLITITNKEDADGRFATIEAKEQNHNGRAGFAHMHANILNDFSHWSEKQTYLNLGNFLLGTAAMGMDSIALEGIDFDILDQEFNLNEKDYTSSVVVALGWHTDTDYNRKLPKSRLAESDIITEI